MVQPLRNKIQKRQNKNTPKFQLPYLYKLSSSKKPMKNIITTVLCTLYLYGGAQERTDNFNLSLFQFGKIKEYSVEINDTGVTSYAGYKKMRSPLIEMYLTNDLFYVNASAYGVFLPALLNSPSFFGNGIEFGWGWQFNRKNPIKLWSNCNAQFGLGFNMGGHFIRSIGDQNSPKIRKNTAYIGPTFGLNIQLGKKLNIQNVLELTFGPKSTQRIELRSNFNYRVLENLGVFIVPCMEGIYDEEEISLRANGATISVKKQSNYKLRYTQIGFFFLLP